MTSHGVVHFEIPADDPDALSRFYTQLFGWRVEKMPMGDESYHITSTVEVDENGMPKEPGAINGGIFKRGSAEQVPINYVNVESVDQYVEEAQRLGATVLAGKAPVPGMGYFAQLRDPQGNPFGVWQTSPDAA